jgi:uncharacterized protein (DUF433 family)
MDFKRITVDPGQMGGAPCIRGLRIPVATVVGMVAMAGAIDEHVMDRAAQEDRVAWGVLERWRGR